MCASPVSFLDLKVKYTVFAISMALSIVLGACNCTAVDVGLRPYINAEVDTHFVLQDLSNWAKFSVQGALLYQIMIMHPHLSFVSLPVTSDNDTDLFL